MELSHLRSRRLESGIVGISMQNKKMKKKKKKDRRRSESVVLLGKEEEEEKRKKKRKRGEKTKVEERFGYALWVHYSPNIDNENSFLFFLFPYGVFFTSSSL